ncbi:hypothetical protein WN944_007636 [Citrus x changshan-huyou]|uniref:Uncharacterized protein n=1 Tax=Citrus x changshan-huyou TaxID=2935761 RepID=A0AAP0MR82_9ROSI
MQVGRDPRPVMREAYNMFKGGGDPEKLVAAFSSGRENEYFYASLYAGLFYESQKKADAAKLHILAACESPYGQRLLIISGLMITWLLLLRFTLFVGTGALFEYSA